MATGLWCKKLLVGSLDAKHNSEMIIPDYSYELSFTKPYMEASAGIENIFKFIRIDAIWRLSYNYHPDITKFGIKFTFTAGISNTIYEVKKQIT